MTVIQSALETLSATPSLAPSDISMSSSTVQHQANTIESDPVQLEVLKLLQQMQQTMKAPNLQTDNGGYNNNGKRGRRQPLKTPDNASYNRNVTNKYCWTHGACGHTSHECNSKASGHQDAATLENHMGGSNAFCPA